PLHAGDRGRPARGLDVAGLHRDEHAVGRDRLVEDGETVVAVGQLLAARLHRLDYREVAGVPSRAEQAADEGLAHAPSAEHFEPYRHARDGTGLRQEPHGVLGGPVDAALEVKVRARGVARGPDVADHLALRHRLALARAEPALVRVQRAEPTAVGDDDHIAVARHLAGEDDLARLGR